MGAEGSLVASADFKSVAVARERRWVGSIPTRSRHISKLHRANRLPNVHFVRVEQKPDIVYAIGQHRRHDVSHCKSIKEAFPVS